MKFDLSSMIATRADRASNLIKKCFFVLLFQSSIKLIKMKLMKWIKWKMNLL